MNILGINISHHTSSCLLQDGKVSYFLEEERISRIKNHSISYTDLKFYGIDILKKYTNSLEYLIFSSYGRNGICNISETTMFEWNEIIQTKGYQYFTNLYISENLQTPHPDCQADIVIINAILKQLGDENIVVGNVIFEHAKHHFYHACSAFYGSGFDEAAALVLDGGGSFFLEDYNELKFDNPLREKESIYFCSSDEIKPTYTHYSHNFYRALSDEFMAKANVNGCEKIFSHNMSCGDLFNFVSINLLGFKSGDDSGKTMGLSSYYQKEFPVELCDEWFYNLNGERVSHPSLFQHLLSLKNYNFTVSEENIKDASMISKKLQDETLKHTLHLIDKTLSSTNSKNIVLSGGYFLNCVNNYEYKKYLPKDVNVYVDPIPHDAGTALGSVQYLWFKLTGNRVKQLENIFLGPK